MTEMKTLTLNGVTYEIVDGKARGWIGDMSALESTAATLVEAINEAMKSGGTGEVDPGDVERIVLEYLAANPPAKGEKGEKGDKGDQGEPGAPGADGEDGQDGADGKDGISPTVSIEVIDGGHRVTITDASGTKSFEVKNGQDGQDGAPGADGKDGEDGYTPVKGEDYFTPEEVAEVAQQAADLVEIPTPEIEQLDAEKVFFSQDLKTTTAIGNIKLTNGQATIPAAGKNLKQVWDTIFVQEKNPATTQPSVEITFNQAKAYEVGTKVTPAYSAKLKAGSYTYGPATGIKATAWTVTDTDDNTADTASGSFPELTVSDNTSYKITAKASYEDGTIPLTNTGNEYPDGQIKAGSKSATSAAITGYRNSFYGTLSEKNELTSGIIRGLAGVSGAALFNGSSFDVAIPVGALRVVIAYPATLRDISSIKDVNGMNAEISSSFVPQTVSVEGANGYQAIDYKVYTLDFANANDTANTFTVTI